MGRHTGHRGASARSIGALIGVLGLIAALLSVVAVTPGLTPPAEASVQDPFVASFSTQDNGAITMTGNSQMSCATATNGCPAARAAAATTSGATAANNNNNWTMAFLDQDTSTATSNSTSADLAVPSGSTVLYALLAWGGRQVAGTGGSPSGTGINQVKLRAPGATAYTTLTGAVTSPALQSGDFSPYYGSVDVTTQVRAAGSGTYWVGDIKAATGVDRYAGWSLTVVYRNPAAPLRDLRVYEGFADVTTAAGNTSVDIPISGFLTPPTGPVNAAMGFVSWEGDSGTTGDSAALVNGATVSPLSDATRPANNFFASAVSELGSTITARNPNYVNNFGVDIGRVNATGLIPNGATSTTVRVNTGGDFYYPTQVTTQVDLFTPAFNPITKTVTNLSGHDPAQPGDTLEYQLNFTNTGADFADNSVIRDVLPTGTSYVPGSLVVTAGTGAGTKTDAAGDDTAEYVAASRTVRFRAGTGATAATGGTLAPNASVATRFRVTVDRAASGTTLSNTALLDYRARTIAKDYTFTGNAVTTPVRSLADLAIGKTSDPAAQVAGNAVTYRLTVTNNGPNAATNVSVSDTLPAGVESVSAAPPAGVTCSQSGRTTTCTSPSLANGATLDIPITVTVPAGADAGSLINTATVSSDTADDTSANNTATATTSVTRSADVTLTKTGTPATVVAGNQVTWTLTASNSGPSSATGVSVVDQLPAGVSLVSATATTGSCAPAGGTVGCQLGTLAAGGSATVTVVGTVATNATVTSIVNAATVSTTTPESRTDNNTATAPTAVTRSADVSVTKTPAAGPFVAGRTANFTMVVSNAGPSDAQGVTLTDALPAGYTFISASSTQGSCQAPTTTVSCAIGTVTAGGTVTVTLRGSLDPGLAPGPLSNTAKVASDTPDPSPANNTSTAQATVTGNADLALTKSADPATVVFGQPVTYTLTVTNNGPSNAGGVITSDPLPAGFTFASSPDGCTAVGTTVSCSVGTVPLGGTATRRFVVNTPNNGSGNVTNTATVRSDTDDPTPANNTASAISNGQAQSDLSIVKTTLTDTPRAGQQIRYGITVSNAGPSTATGAVVTDTLPTGITFVSGTGTGGVNCTAAGQTVTCPLGAVDVGGQSTITLVGLVGNNTRGNSANTASVSSGGTDPTPGNNISSSSTTVLALADLGVTLTPRQTTVTAGQQVTYDLVVVNNGPSTAIGVVVTGQVPPGMTPDAGSSGGACVVTDGIVTCNLGDLPSGANLTIPLIATVDSSTGAGSISGSATIGSSTSDPVPDNNISTAAITVVTSADLQVAKSVDPTVLVAGTTASYTVAVTNAGPSDAVGTVVTDTLPAGLTAGPPSADRGSCDLQGQQIRCTVASLSAGRAMTVTIPVTVAANATGTLSNTATASSSTPDPVPGNDSATVTSTVGSSADLRLSKTTAADRAVAGQAVDYTLTLTNAGPSDAAGAALTDTLPNGLTVLPNGIEGPAGACTVSTDRTRVDCALGTLPAGQSRVVTISALVPQNTAAGTVLSNTATATAGTTDPTPEDATATVATPVDTAADLSVAKTSVNNPVEAGTEQTYVITVANNGPSLARGVLLTDRIPPGTSFVAATAGVGSCALTDGAVTCTAGDLPAGRTETAQITVRLDSDIAGSTLANTAAAESRPATGDPTPDPDTDDNTSTVSQVVAARSDLTLAKSITSGPIVAGSDVTYRVTLRNGGPSDAADPFITDPVPAGTTYRSATASDGGSCRAIGTGAATQVRCDWTSIPVGATRTADLVVRVPGDAAPGSTVSNTVTGGSDSLDPTPPTATVDGPVTAAADLQTEKVLLSGPPVAGGTVRWQVTVHNGGPSAASAATLTDAIPDGVTVVDSGVTTGQGSCTITGREIDCALGTIAPGANAAVVIAGTLSPEFNGTTLTNSATAASATPDPNPADNTGSVTTPTTTLANLTISKSGAPDTLTAGSQVTWTLTVANPTGPSDADDVVVTDRIPAGVDAITASVPGGTCTVDADRLLRCTVASVAVGATSAITLTGTVNAAYSAGQLGNSAAVAARTPDPDQSDNTATATNPVTTSADLVVGKTGPARAAAGAPIRWTVTVTNNGPSDALDVRVTDTLPIDLVGPAAVGPAGSCPIADGTVSCAVGRLAPGATATVDVTATVDPSSTAVTLTNVAAATSSTPDANPGNNSASVVTGISSSANLSITKQQDGAVVAGERVNWVITVDNTGPSTARNVIVADTLPAGVGDPAGTVPGVGACAVDGQNLSCPVGTVAAGAPVQIRVSGLLAADYPGQQLTNTSTVTSDTQDPAGADNSSTVSTDVQRSADLQIGKAVTSGPPVAGTQVTFEIDVTNNGPSDATDVTITDPLPTQVTDPQVSTPQGSCAITDAVLGCSLGAVPNGQSVRVTLTGTIAQDVGQDLANSATVASAVDDPSPANNSSTAVATIGESANLAVSKTGPATATAGDGVSWTVRVDNAGPSIARQVVLSDVLPDGISAVRVGGVDCPDPAQCVLGDIAPGGATTVTVSGTLAAGYQGSSLVNRASATSATPDPDARDNTATATSAVVRSAVFAVSKQANPTALVPGAPATYTIQVHNNGPSDGPAALLTDPLPDGVTVRAPGVQSSQGGCQPVGPRLDCSLGTVAAGDTVTVTVPVSIDPSFTGDGIRNAAVASNPYGPDAEGSVTSEVTPQADLTLRKTAPTSVVAGSSMAWSLQVTNSGPSTARDVVLTDHLPVGVGDVDVTASQGTCTVQDRTVSCVIGALASGDAASIRVAIDGVLDPSFTGTTLVNTADVSSPTPEPQPADPDDPTQGGRHASTTTTVSAAADVQVFKSNDLLGPAAPGQRVAWTVVVRNNGPSTARAVSVTDRLPAGLTDVQFGPAGVDCTAAGVCTVGDLLPGIDNQQEFTVSGVIDPDLTAAQILNTATAVSSTDDPVPGNNTDDSSISLAPSADLQIDKADSGDPVVAGGPIRWTITVTNAGPSTARNVTVTDELPAQVADAKIDGTLPAGVNCAVTAQIVCTATAVPPGVLTIPIVATVDPGTTGSVTNTAGVTADTADPDPTNNTDAVTTDLGTSANVSLTKTGPATAAAGTEVTWELTVTGHGPSTARNVVVADPTPTHVTGMTFQPPTGVDCADGRCTIGDLAPGQTRTVTVHGVIDPAEIGTVTNTATMSSSTPDPDPDDNSATVSTDVTGSADLTVHKVADQQTAAPGERVSWRLTVNNAGPSVAHQVRVTDDLPAGLQEVSFTAPAGVQCTDAGCELADLAPGGEIVIAVSALVRPDVTAAELVNTASVASDTADPDPSGNTATSPPIALRPSADLTINKRGPAGPVTAGQEINWTITVANAGPSTGHAVTMVDTLPAGLTGVTVTAANGAACTSAGVCAIGDLSPGGSTTITVHAVVADDYRESKMVNSATVRSDTSDPNADNNTGTVDSVIEPHPPTGPPPTTGPTTPPTTGPTGPTTGPTTRPTTGPTTGPSNPSTTGGSTPTNCPTCPPDTQPPAPPGGPLPNTGVPAAEMAWWALALILAGAALTLFAGRRRRGGHQAW